ncbi:MAG: DUF1574 family protein [Leptospirales bacterium]
MDFIKYRVLWLPLLFAAGLFIVDKVFFLTPVRRATEHWSRLEDYFYGSRERLFRLLQQEAAEVGSAADVVLIYGSSRSAPFPVKLFAAEFPGARLYNFSAPSAAPSYYHYWNSRIRREVGPRVRLALIEIDAGLFTYEALQPSLAYSYDAEFIIKYLDWRGTGAGFSLSNAESFFARRMFALLKYPLVAEHIIENQRELRYVERGREIVTSQLAIKDRLFAMMAESFEALRGGIPYPVPRTYDPEELADHAKEAAKRYRGDSATRASQLFFMRSLLEDLARDGAPVLIYWPIVADPLREHLLRAGGGNADLKSAVEAELAALRERYPEAPMRLIDLNDSAQVRCREFSDSYHLAGRCFDDLTRELMRAFRRP